MIKATNKATGEVVELETDTFEQIVEAWRVASEYEKTAKALKDQLKKLVPDLIGERGMSEEYKGYAFRVSNVQRMTYDKAVMRDVLDADTFDVLLVPDKTLVDTYLKENLELLGEASTLLRNAMIPVGAPYQIIKLEKLSRD